MITLIVFQGDELTRFPPPERDEASIDQVEISLPLFLIGFALGQIIGGPISNNYG